MVGYVSSEVAKALKEWQPLKDANVYPTRAAEGATVVIDTPLPCIVVHVYGNDGEGNTYIGGGIRQYFELSLLVLTPLTNYTFSPDGGLQANTLDLSDEVIRCMENTELLNYLKQTHDFNAQFDRFESDTTYATNGANSVTVDVHRVVYKCDVEFDAKDDKYKQYAILQRVDGTINERIKTTIE